MPITADLTGQRSRSGAEVSDIRATCTCRTTWLLFGIDCLQRKYLKPLALRAYIGAPSYRKAYLIDLPIRNNC